MTFKELNELMNKVYGGGVTSEKTKMIFHHLDSLERGKFVGVSLSFFAASVLVDFNLS